MRGWCAIVNETPVALQVDLDQSVLTLDRRLAHDELTSEDRADIFHHFQALLKVTITNAIHRNERESTKKEQQLTDEKMRKNMQDKGPEKQEKRKQNNS